MSNMTLPPGSVDFIRDVSSKTRPEIQAFIRENRQHIPFPLNAAGPTGVLRAELSRLIESPPAAEAPPNDTATAEEEALLEAIADAFLQALPAPIDDNEYYAVRVPDNDWMLDNDGLGYLEANPIFALCNPDDVDTFMDQYPKDRLYKYRVFDGISAKNAEKKPKDWRVLPCEEFIWVRQHPDVYEKSRRGPKRYNHFFYHDGAKGEAPSQPLLIHDETDHKFLLFDRCEYYLEWLGSADRRARHRTFHEVILGELPQKLKIDIDAAGGAIDHLPAPEGMTPREYLFKGVMDALLCAFRARYGIELDAEKDCAVADSSNETKFSRHVIVKGYHVTSSDGAAAFAAELLNQLPPWIRAGKFIDFGVNKSTQNFRLPGRHKVDHPRRVKRIIQGEHDDFIITDTRRTQCVCKMPFGARLKRARAAGYTGEHTNLTKPLLEAAIGMLRPYADGLEFAQYNGKYITFFRIRASYCKICQADHGSDNTLYGTVHNGMVVAHCHGAQRRGIKSYTFAGMLPGFKPKKFAPRNQIPKMVTAPMPDDRPEFQPKRFTPGDLIADEYDAHAMKPYTDYIGWGTLLVHAKKGVGKTEALANYIRAKQPATIIAIVHRRTLAMELTRQFAEFGFVMYSDVKDDKGVIDCAKYPRLIIQVESLHCLSLRPSGGRGIGPDLLIMDEIESLIEQLGSGLHRHFDRTFMVFDALRCYSKQVIAMDANVGSRAVRALACRSKVNGKFIYVRNTRRPHSEWKYNVTTTFDTWKDYLFADLAAGKRLVIPSNSASAANSLAKSIAAQFPDKQMKLYTGDMDKGILQADIGNISAAWSGLDVLIYTPTITAGVSFKEENQFDKIYAYFTSKSCSVQSCDQMLGRVRSLAAKEMNVYVDNQRIECPLTYDELRESILRNIASLETTYDTRWLCPMMRPDGSVYVQNEGYFELMVENQLAMNRTRNNMLKSLIDMFRANGATVAELTRGEMQSVKLNKDIEESRRESKQEKGERISAARELSNEEFSVLCKASEISREDKYAMHKKTLRMAYRYDGEMPPHWVAVFDNPGRMKLASRLHEAKEKSLEEIQWTQYSIGPSDNGIACYSRSFEKHRIVQAILGCLGAREAVRDHEYEVEFTRNDLKAIIAEHTATWEAEFPKWRTTFKASKLAARSFRDYGDPLIIINIILTAVYDMRLASPNNTKEMRDIVMLKRSSYFHPDTLQPVMPQSPEEREEKIQSALAIQAAEDNVRQAKARTRAAEELVNEYRQEIKTQNKDLQVLTKTVNACKAECALAKVSRGNTSGTNARLEAAKQKLTAAQGAVKAVKDTIAFTRAESKEARNVHKIAQAAESEAKAAVKALRMNPNLQITPD